MFKAKTLEKGVFRQVISHYYFQISGKKIINDLGTSKASLVAYIYGPDDIPEAVLKRLLALLPQARKNTQDRIKRKIEKLEKFAKSFEETEKSDANQLKALILQKQKGKRIAKEEDEFDLKDRL